MDEKPNHVSPDYAGESRRQFLTKSAIAPIAASVLCCSPGDDPAALSGHGDGNIPWYRCTYRWGQTNMNELDPLHYDVAWWRSYWKRTQTQGVIINAGGIYAFYPSKHPLHRHAEFLRGRDLYGDLTRAAHADGLRVFARMDCSCAFEPFYKAHPEWFAVNAEGRPYRLDDLLRAYGLLLADTNERFLTCIHGPYYEEYIPEILREIISWEKPDGFTDNMWSGPGRQIICYCNNCKSSFHQFSGGDLPNKKNWDDPVYRRWIEWSYRRRLEIWDLYNRTTRTAGGSDCIWSGMLSGNFVSAAAAFRDMKDLCERADIVMLDHQGRSVRGGFQQNGETGRRIHELAGWDKLAPESMATYGPGLRRKAARPFPEVQMWRVEGIAGGIQPWWHHVGGYQEDRRQFEVVEQFYRWHAANQDYLVNRKPIATVGVVYSQRNFEWYGRDNPNELALSPYEGMIQALLRARIPCSSVHADHIERDERRFSVLILPNLAAMSNAQVEAVRRFVGKGGSLIATDETSLYDEYGDRRTDFALADVLAASYTGKRHGPEDPARVQHSYLRLTPDVGKDIDGPRSGDEPPRSETRHPVLRGFEKTNVISFGGVLPEVTPAPGTTVLLTLVPDFPAYPPENSWMRVPRTSIPGLMVKERNGARIAYLPADIDRCFERDDLPDHGDLLANLVRWAARDSLPLEIHGPGLIDCGLYSQQSRMILHVVNLTSAGTWRAPVHELVPVGPLMVKVKLPEGVAGNRVLLRVSGGVITPKNENGWIRFEVKSVLDHEMAVVD